MIVRLSVWARLFVFLLVTKVQAAPVKSIGILDRDLIAQSVDAKFSDDELLKVRVSPSHSTDMCMGYKSVDQNTFVDPLAEMVQRHLKTQPIYDEVFARVYKLQENPTPVSLMSHPMCIVDHESLKKITRKTPDIDTVHMVNQVALIFNGHRARALRGSEDSVQDLQKFWLKLTSCLGYSESLGTADLPASRSIASRYAPRTYNKPEGVKFYYDRAQRNINSRLNIGLFQFSPLASGNVSPCIYNWNRDVASVKPECHINPAANKNEMINILGASRQVFNAYCGVNKILQNFYTQVNTTSPKLSFETNVVGGALKDPSQRCVTMHMKSGLAYNHFGPFQNTTGDNLKKLMSCVLE